MLRSSVAFAVAGLASCQTFDEIVAHVNSLNTTWIAEKPSRFGFPDDVKALCGAILKDDPRYKEMLTQKVDSGFSADAIPDSFDVRTAFPKCANVSGHVRDQSTCGSCWAFGSTEAFNDRRCIATGDTTLLSTEDTLSNCGILHCSSMGCSGGQPGAAWHWFTNYGVVTGGDFDANGKGDSCAPYSFKPCAHHVPATPKYPACSSGEGPTPRIGSSCTEKSYKTAYAQDKKKAASAYSLSGVASIQKDMMQYGSATAAFTVYADFPTYKSGVYKHTHGDQLGGHAIKLVGWGTENGQDYWTVMNSWNEEWGDHGIFKIARGTNECGIEGQVSAGTVAANEIVV